MRKILLGIALLVAGEAFADDAELLRAAATCEAHRSSSKFNHVYTSPWNEVCVPLAKDFDALYDAGRSRPKAAPVVPEPPEVLAGRKAQQAQEQTAFAFMSDEDKKAFVEKKRNDAAAAQKAALEARIASDAELRKNPEYEFMKAKVLSEGKARPEWWVGR